VALSFYDSKVCNSCFRIREIREKKSENVENQSKFHITLQKNKSHYRGHHLKTPRWTILPRAAGSLTLISEENLLPIPQEFNSKYNFNSIQSLKKNN
jgi:hypothetical protein